MAVSRPTFAGNHPERALEVKCDQFYFRYLTYQKRARNMPVEISSYFYVSRPFQGCCRGLPCQRSVSP